ncbi:transcription factor TFIIIC subunit tfc4 [Saxophila tyrrhenica]|uniref:Transcription factor TFIIIC subunit tfc4 n=1 Tax=Saxophila tyrrhenica TaxID=1690608 RepID=A0AAV9PL00_9PEZI|nr:transcription factor TFIIIC subunit tfc4 [Saxophila tyrrhenica]
MDEDTLMQDGPHDNYPEPEAASSTPYPALSDNGPALYLPENGLLDGESPPVTTPPATSSQSAAGSGFSTLADFYQLGEKALFNLSQLNNNAREGRRWADPTSGIVYDRAPADQPRSFTTDTSHAASNRGPLALPGFHFLPDNDRLDSFTRQAQQHPPFSLISTRNSPPPPPVRAKGPGRPRGSGRGSVRGGWKKALKGTEHEDLFKKPRLTREAMGTRKARPRGRGRGKAIADPGHEYKTLQARATTAYLDNDLEAAKEYTLAALKVNPEVWASYSLLFEITQKQGLEIESIQVLASGAPVKRDPETWVEVANRLRALKGEDISEVEREFVLKCYEEAIKLEANNFSARRARMQLYCEVGYWHKARKECATILSLHPENLEILWQYAKLCDTSGLLDDIRGAIDFYQRAFYLQSNQPTFGPAEEQWDHLNMYLEMVIKTGPAWKGLQDLKRIARWFLGRHRERFWEDVTQDDREFDEGPERRILLPQVQLGLASQDSSLYGLGLPIELRVKLGIFRLQMGSDCHSEAFRHFEPLRQMSDPEDIDNLADLFLDVANNLRARFMYGAAVEFYDRLKPVSGMMKREYWMSFALCCREVGRNDEAEECYKKVINADAQETQARINLIKLYESTSRSLKALPIADELIGIGRTESLRHANLSTYVTACRRLKKRELKPKPRKISNAQTDAEYDLFDGSDDEQEVTAESVRPPSPPRPSRPPQKLKPLAAKPLRNPLSEQATPPVPIQPTFGDVPDSSEDESEDSQDEDQVDEVNHAGENNDEGGNAIEGEAAQGPTFARRGRYLDSLREQKERVESRYAKLTELWPEADKNRGPAIAHEWIQHAAAMANEFKLIKEFYPMRHRDKLFTGLRTGIDTESREMVAEMTATRKKLLETAASLGQMDGTAISASTAETEFHGLTFAEWHRIFSNLALRYAQRSDHQQCYHILNSVLKPANVFREDPELSKATLSVSLCCAFMFNDTRFVLELTKRIERVHGSAATTHLIAACSRLGYGETRFYSRKTHNWLSAAVDEQDFMSMPSEARDQYEWDKYRSKLDKKLEAASDAQPAIDAGVLTTYAHTIGHSSYGEASIAALPYLLRALAIEPENVVINLSISTVYGAHAARKGLSTSHYEVAQALAFLHRYYDLRVASGKVGHIQEAEYNMARMWHLLKMTHLAVPAYEKVLELSSQVQREAKGGERDEAENYAREAALALKSMYAAVGNDAAARTLTEAWLVL